jgi:hypothetical protein
MTAPYNEPAFPRDHAADGHNGMTLRDYFAAKELVRMEHAQCAVNDVQGAYARVAGHCYRMADAMLAERSKVAP